MDTLIAVSTIIDLISTQCGAMAAISIINSGLLANQILAQGHLLQPWLIMLKIATLFF